ncbi:MAG: CDP-glucose 4,6-dehydratase [Hahellaceae bacterium]|nr:CDP-glucose 4,6-dehydratase [Hahellaceae bacterium]MCP5211270.1 CDP-glucose 4,6-dehydratase [Hahellaceae bacterium]
MELSQIFGEKYKGTRVLLTGHTGFKGSWLSLWLQQMGAVVKGISLPDDNPESHWEQLSMASVEDDRLDIRNFDKLRDSIDSFSPEIVFHLAAQSLVRRGYAEPLENWSTNVMGTANLLEVCRSCESLKAIVVVTTDKCYSNKEWCWGYRENDVLGGHDPYSASKAAVELLVASYRSSFYKGENTPLIATARAGNVIGGGDWSDDRLIPDVMKSQLDGRMASIRSPNATRPWQHVLESLSAYLLLGQKLLESDSFYADAWNFGPGNEGNCRVIDVLGQLQKSWKELKWELVANDGPYEASLLQLDCAKALHRLSWKPVWSLWEGIDYTAKWYQAWQNRRAIISEQQLMDYVASAVKSDAVWCKR